MSSESRVRTIPARATRRLGHPSGIAYGDGLDRPAPAEAASAADLDLKQAVATRAQDRALNDVQSLHAHGPHVMDALDAPRGPSCHEAGHRPTSSTRPRAGHRPTSSTRPAAPPATRAGHRPTSSTRPRAGHRPHIIDAPAAPPATRRDTAPRHRRARGPSCHEAGHRPTSSTRPRPLLPRGGTPPHVMDAPAAPPARRRDTARSRRARTTGPGDAAGPARAAPRPRGGGAPSSPARARVRP